MKSISKGYAVVETNRTGRLRARIATDAKDKLSVGDDTMIFIRPEALDISEQKAKTDTRITAQVKHSEFEGQTYNVFLEGDAGKEMKMSLVNPRRSAPVRPRRKPNLEVRRRPGRCAAGRRSGQRVASWAGS